MVNARCRSCSGSGIFRRPRPFLLGLFLVIGVASTAHAALPARAGGGGSYSGGGGGGGGGGFGGGGGGGSGTPLSGGAFAAIAAAVGGIIVYGAVQQRRQRRPGLSGSPDALPELATVDLAPLRQRDPSFDEAAFCQRAVALAQSVNDAWCAGNMGPARSQISDAVYVRFQTQLRLMKAEGVRNVMGDLSARAKIIAFESDDRWDSVDVRLDCSAKDIKVPVNATEEEIRHGLNSSTSEPFTEVWSFIRRRGATTKADAAAGHEAHHCANCGAPIESGEVTQCSNCKALTNSGEHDWVLAEITQAGEYAEELEGPTVDLSAVQAHDPAVSRQAIEDRASMLFWKWLDARVTHDRTRLTRFGVSDDTPPAPPAALTDPAVGAVRLLQAGTNNDTASIALVEVEWSASQNGAHYPVHHIHHLTLTRALNASSPNGLYPLGCPVCGGPIPDTDSTSCKFCRTEIGRDPNGWCLAAVEDHGG